MEPISWSLVASLIVQYGFPLAMKLVEKWQNKEPVSVAAIQELYDMAKETPQLLASQVIAAKGLDPADPKVVAFLELLKPKTS